ncbi:MAG: hypothetical protein M1277_00550 [Patescibacteria group bacterium]|nr:hypothetical protein [Patescibacteria group bacterium]
MTERLSPHEGIVRTAKRLILPNYDSAVRARESVRDNIAYLRDVYGLTVEMRGQTEEDEQSLAINKLKLIEAGDATRVLRKEISKYPPEFIEQCRVKAIRFVFSLKQGENVIDGVTYPDGTVYVVATPLVNNTIHHELFHASDYNQHSRMNPRLKDFGRVLEYRYWNLVNHNGYVGDKYEGCDSTGFATDYGRMNVYEDRATVAELLMTYPQVATIRAAEDPVLSDKIDRIKTIMRQRSGGRMNLRYFSDLTQGKVREGYWG